MSTQKARYLIVVPFMDLLAINREDPLVQPETFQGVVEASSLEIAKEIAFAFAIEMACWYYPSVEESKELPFEAARKLLRENSLHVGDPAVIPLEELPNIELIASRGY